MDINHFKEKIKAGEKVSFQTTMSAVESNFDYQPVAFKNGIGADQIKNAAGSNEGSCKIFALGKILGLTEAETLTLFGDYYWQDVLKMPDGTDHMNIRTFMKHGWAGISFESDALKARH